MSRDIDKWIAEAETLMQRIDWSGRRLSGSDASRLLLALSRMTQLAKELQEIEHAYGDEVTL